MCLKQARVRHQSEPLAVARHIHTQGGDSISLSTHIDDVVNEIKWKDLERVVLVGHSYGGMVITGVVERMRERIAAIVYLDAFLPQDGQSLSAIRNSNATQWPERLVPPRDGLPVRELRCRARSLPSRSCLENDRDEMRA